MATILNSPRGYACIALDNPKTPANVGSAVRACGVYGASHLFYTGQRYKKAKSFVTDPAKYHRHIPVIHTDDLYKSIPIDCVPVAVELTDNAKNIINYVHPERAFYIFGPEDGNVRNQVIDFCRDVIYVPTNGCMNLAATVNVVLYDRLCKSTK